MKTPRTTRLLGLFVLLASACADEFVEPSNVRELGVIEGIVDTETGRVELTFVPATDDGQALTAVTEDKNGVVGTAAVSQSVEFIVECNGVACAAPFTAPGNVVGGCGLVNTFEFDVTFRSFFPEGLKSAHVRFDQIQGIDNTNDFSLCSEDPVSPNFTLSGAPLTRGAGLLRYSGLAADANGGAAGGPLDASDTVRWRFRAPGGRFKFRAVPVAEVCTATTCGAAVVEQRFWQVEGIRSTSGVLALQEAAGSVFVGGEFSYVGPRTGNAGRVTDHTSSGTAATLTWPAVEGGVVKAIVDDGAGGAYIGGSFTTVGGVARAGFAQIAADGSVLPLAANVTGTVNAIAVTTTHVVLGGSFTAVAGVARTNLAAIQLSTSTVDVAWAGAANGAVHALLTDTDDVYVGGAFTQIGAVAAARLTRVNNATGVVDAAFAGSVGVNDGIVSAISVASGAPSGGRRIFIGGTFTTTVRGGASPATRTRVAAIDGTTFAVLPFAPVANGAVTALQFSSGSVVLAGAFTRIGASTRQKVARVDATTGALTAFNPSVAGNVDALDISDDGTVYIAGAFPQVDGNASFSRFAALNATTGRAVSWQVIVGPNNGATTNGGAILARGTEVLLGGTFSSLGGLRRNGVAELNLATGSATAWDAGLGGATPTVRAIAITDQGIALGGVFTSGGNVNYALHDRTTAALVGGVVANGPVNDIVFSSGTTYLGGAFTTVAGQARNNLAALAGSSLVAWTPAPNDAVNALAVVNDQLYVGGRFTAVSGGAGRTLVSIGLVGAANAAQVITNWNAGSTVTGLAACRDVVVAVGLFTTVQAQTRRGFAVLGRSALGARQFTPTGTLTGVDCAGNSISLAGALVASTRAGQVNLFDAAQPTIDHQFNSSLAVVTAQVGDIQFVGGSFANVGTAPRTGLVAYRAD
jgi:hypothetical protein